jgi:hypothetical protein
MALAPEERIKETIQSFVENCDSYHGGDLNMIFLNCFNNDFNVFSVVITAFAFFVLLYIGFIFMSYLCIKGTKNVKKIFHLSHLMIKIFCFIQA